MSVQFSVLIKVNLGVKKLELKVVFAGFYLRHVRVFLVRHPREMGAMENVLLMQKKPRHKIM